MKVGLTYSQAFRLGLHGLTFSLLFDMLKSVMGVTIPYTYTAPFIIWMVIVFTQLKNIMKHVFPLQNPLDKISYAGLPSTAGIYLFKKGKNLSLHR